MHFLTDSYRDRSPPSSSRRSRRGYSTRAFACGDSLRQSSSRTLPSLARPGAPRATRIRSVSLVRLRAGSSETSSPARKRSFRISPASARPPPRLYRSSLRRIPSTSQRARVMRRARRPCEIASPASPSSLSSRSRFALVHPRRPTLRMRRGAATPRIVLPLHSPPRQLRAQKSRRRRRSAPTPVRPLRLRPLPSSPLSLPSLASPRLFSVSFVRPSSRIRRQRARSSRCRPGLPPKGITATSSSWSAACSSSSRLLVVILPRYARRICSSSISTWLTTVV